jgi:DnaJ homolog subfamily C member 2
MQGTIRRWEQVAAYVRTRTLDEVMVMVKQHKGAAYARYKVQEDWKSARKGGVAVSTQAAPDIAFDRQNAASPPPIATIETNTNVTAAATGADGGPSVVQGTKKGLPAGVHAAGAKQTGRGGEADATDGMAGTASVNGEDDKWSEEQELALVRGTDGSCLGAGHISWSQLSPS